MIPVDLMDVFQQAGVPFFEGCLMVEIHDHRKPTANSTSNASQFGPDGRKLRPSDTSLHYLREGGRYGFHSGHHHGRSSLLNNETSPSPDGVEIYRMILRSSDEALWNDLRMMDAKAGGTWNDDDALRIESRILHLTAPPLCLAPDPHVTRIANIMQSCTMPPVFYSCNKEYSPYPIDEATGHKLNSIEVELAESQDARRLQIMNMMKDGWSSAPSRQNVVPGEGNAFVPGTSRLEFLKKLRQNHANASHEGETQSTQPAPTAHTAQAPLGTADSKKAPASQRKKRGKGNDESITPESKTGSAATQAKTAKRRKKESSPSDDKGKAKGEVQLPSSPHPQSTPDTETNAALAATNAASPTKGRGSPLVLPGGASGNKGPKNANSPVIPTGKMTPTLSSALLNAWNKQNNS